MGASVDSRIQKYLTQSIKQFIVTARKKNMLLQLCDEWSEILEGSKFSLEAEDSKDVKVKEKKHKRYPRKARLAPVFKMRQDNMENDKDGIISDDKTAEYSKTNTRSHVKKKEKRSVENSSESKKTDRKKPAMRTAHDVIER